MSRCDLRTEIEKNRMNAFRQYVRDWKKQDPDTVTRNGDIFTYRTKRGLVKRFKAHETVPCEAGAFKVQGFWFVPA